MKAFRIPTDRETEVVELPIRTPDDEPDVLKEEIGGWIEVVRTGPGTALIVDEEGLLKDLPPNVLASSLTGRLIVGPALLVGMTGSPDGDVLTDLPPGALKAAEELQRIIKREEGRCGT